MLITALVFFLILTILVLIHEAGHFFVAKWLGIKVEEFGFGLPPRAFGIKKGETIYSVNWLPFGGFVKLYGEDDAGAGKLTAIKKAGDARPADVNRAFFAKTAWQRASVVVAGVVMNTVLAIAIFYVYMLISGFKADVALLGDYRFSFVEQRNVIAITDVSKNSPAEKLGIKRESKIVAVNGEPIENIKSFVGTINIYKGKEITITWLPPKGQSDITSKITPRVNPPKNEGALGIAFVPVPFAELTYKTPAQKVLSGIIHPYNLAVYNFAVMKDLIASSFKARDVKPLGQGVAGPVGIYSLVGAIVQIPDLKERVLQVLNLAGILSISLAIFNVLPIPALDGGRLFFILIEAVSGYKVNQKFENYAHAIGMAVLISLLLLITFKDVFQLFR